MKAAEREKMLREKLRELKVIEESWYEKGAVSIAGVDEVGRGPLAGPVVAACVIFPRDIDILGINDSKKLSEKKRMALAPEIKEKALAFGLGMAGEKVIDEINILEATKGAMAIAVKKAGEKLKQEYSLDISEVLVDGNALPSIPYRQQAVVKGDSKSISIAAASILAKVTRDAMMVQYEEEYPGYDFAANKGYGTKKHYAGLEKLGMCPIHRRSFLKKFVAAEDGNR